MALHSTRHVLRGEDTKTLFLRAKRKRVRVPIAHNQKRRGQNTTPANHRKTRNPTPTPRKRGRTRPLGTPQGRGDCNNRRTNARTSSEPRNHRREGPQKVGEKTCTVHMKAKRPKRQEKTRKDRKKDEKARTIQRRGHKAEKGSAVQDCPPNSLFDTIQGRKGERCTELSPEQQRRARDTF